MRVLHVIPSVAPRYGGPSQAIFTTCRSLSEKRIDVCIATTDADGDGELAVPIGELIKYRDIQTIFFHRQWSESLKYSSHLAKWVEAHVDKFNLVHIHAVFSHACITTAKACRKRKIPYLVRPLGTLDPWSLRQKPFRKQLFWHLGVKQMLAGADAIHYTTEEERRLVESGLGVKNGVVVPNGLDLSFDAGGKEESGVGLAEVGEDPYIVALSRIHPKKGFELLIEALSSLRDMGRFREWRLVIAGDGEPDYVATLKRFIANRGMSDIVHFVGWLAGDRKAAALRGASLLAMPSYQENFGNSLIEGMAFGVPVLVSTHVNLAPEIEAADAGWIAQLNLESLADRLAEALSQERERKRRGECGRELAAQYEASVVADKLIALYQSILSRRP